MKKDEIINELSEVIQKIIEQRQNRPDQYIVAYMRKDNDELIGYHLSTFCQITSDILQAKRYSGKDPYPQLGIIWKNITYALSQKSSDGIFSSVYNRIKEEDFKDLTADDIYIDAIHLSEGMPKQEIQFVTFKNENDGTESNKGENT